MAAPKGNQFWKARSKHGRDKLFASPWVLWEACCEYFQWNQDNPLFEVKAFAYQGVVVQESIPKMRAMTVSGLCLFLDVDVSTWSAWKQKEDFSTITARAENIIRQQKFEGASADLLNANIIARDLGLIDKTDLSSSDRSMSPQPTTINLVAAKRDV
jgi:hypothetical protein